MHFRTTAFICLSIASVILAGPITSKYDAKAGPGVALVKKSASKVGKGYESSKRVWKGKKRAYGHGGDDDHGDDKDDGHDYDHGFEDGHRDAYKEGYADGKDKGYWKGFENGSKEGGS
ncbi:hypothetical protein K7432_009906 [Basidiobolus ranarum]|uniref:Uncharacterized protein n=1 Tax=Basidiobolus ranarum TaxID=34480 RepID=A0ABR2VWB3_9FUNG